MKAAMRELDTMRASVTRMLISFPTLSLFRRQPSIPKEQPLSYEGDMIAPLDCLRIFDLYGIARSGYLGFVGRAQEGSH
jgi:hypothetical protein